VHSTTLPPLLRAQPIVEHAALRGTVAARTNSSETEVPKMDNGTVRKARAEAIGASATGVKVVAARLIGPTAFGPVALGVAAIGAIAIGKVVISEAVIRKLRSEEIEIGLLKVRELEVAGRRWPEPDA
jgi:hypothetical protein